MTVINKKQDNEPAAPIHATISAAFCAAQGDMPSGVKPEGKNPHFRSNYVTLADLSQAVLPVLNRHGLAVAMSVVANGEQGATMEARLFHAGGEVWTFAVPLGVAGLTDPQRVGSAITYARRQLLGMISGVAPDEDDDGNAAAAVSQATRKAPPPAKAAPLPKPPPPSQRTGTPADLTGARSAEMAAALIARLGACIAADELAELGKEIKRAVPDMLTQDVEKVREAYREAAVEVGA